MKISIINVSLRPESKSRLLPVGLAYISTAIKNAGFEFDLVDMDIDDISVQAFKDIVDYEVSDVYLLGCIVTGYRIVKEVADAIKEANPQSLIICGNSVATSIPEILMKNTKIDIGVMGEGDITIVELLRVLEKKGDVRTVAGIVLKDKDEVIFSKPRPLVPKLDAIPFPDWNLFDLEKYNIRGKIVLESYSSDKVMSFPLNSARGCPFNCTFCYHVFKGEKYRKYSEEAIVSEIERLYTNHNCDFISFWDELSFPSIKSVEKRLDALEKLGINVGWSGPIRGNLFKEEHLELIKRLKASGCESLGFALENGSQEILAAMNKKINVKQFIEQAKVLRKGGVIPLTSVVFGYPQETPKTIQRTLEICEECEMYPSVGFLLPMPGTQIYQWAIENGSISNEIEYLERFGDRQDLHVNLTNMPDEEFVNTVESGLRKLGEKLGIEPADPLKTGGYKRVVGKADLV